MTHEVSFENDGYIVDGTVSVDDMTLTIKNVRAFYGYLCGENIPMNVTVDIKENK